MSDLSTLPPKRKWQAASSAAPTSSVEEIMGKQPDKPKNRRYDWRTGSEWFTVKNMGPFYKQNTQYFNPFIPRGGSQDPTAWRQLASEYGGTPVVFGYQEEISPGVWGAFTPTKSLYSSASIMNELANLEQPKSFEDWIAAGGNQTTFTPDLMSSAPAQGITGILNRDITQNQDFIDAGSVIQDSLDLDDEYAAADERSALALGFHEVDVNGDPVLDSNGNPVADMDAYRTYLANTRAELDAGVQGQQGVIGTQYEDAFRRNVDSAIYQTVTQNQQLIESLGTQSSAAAYSKMSEVSDQIANMTIQAEFKLIEQDLLTKEAEYEALLSRYEATSAVAESERIGYMNAIAENRANALYGYATRINSVLTEQSNQIQGFQVQLNTLVQQNQQVYQEYEADIRAMTAHAEMTYNHMMAQIGYDEHLMNQVANEYDTYMTPFYDSLESWATQLNIAMGAEDLAQGQQLIDLEAANSGVTIDEDGRFVPQAVEDPTFLQRNWGGPNDPGAIGATTLQGAGVGATVGLGMAGAGAGAGAAAGSVVPIVGTLVGAAAGFLLGLFLTSAIVGGEDV